MEGQLAAKILDEYMNVIKSFEIDAKGIEKFPTNFTGMTIEHLINSMLEVDKQNSLPFLEENKRKLDFIGKIDNGILALPMVFNLDGTVTALRKKDKEMEERLNSTTKKLKEQIGPLVDYIQNDIFNKADTFTLYAYDKENKLKEVPAELWHIQEEDGTLPDKLTEDTLYEVHVMVEDGGEFDLSDTEKEIKIAVILGNK